MRGDHKGRVLKSVTRRGKKKKTRKAEQRKIFL